MLHNGIGGDELAGRACIQPLARTSLMRVISLRWRVYATERSRAFSRTAAKATGESGFRQHHKHIVHAIRAKQRIDRLASHLERSRHLELYPCHPFAQGVENGIAFSVELFPLTKGVFEFTLR